MTVKDGSFQPAFFDPLSTEHLTEIICQTLERQPLFSMAEQVPRFDGAGLYAIYYRGESVGEYTPLARTEIPLYAGQGASHNSATGRVKSSLRPVYLRLKAHRRSIDEGGLLVAEFEFRVLLMPDVHADLGEDGLRRLYQPVWNSVLTGFGSHEQGAATRQSGRSKWDTFHAGRARSFGDSDHSIDELERLVAAHIDQQLVHYPDLPWPHPVRDLPGS
ncbi:Eco29kI family restriction endonuclease [Nocardia sp. NPDC060256]|uniref:Eco29kI family restriction endonuclease n=1 Tax=unclassified Nocardia TaxID=2637762 RepID=UPI0036493DF5